METKMNVNGLSTYEIDKLLRIKHAESELFEVAQQVGVNNRLEIFDNDLIDRYIFLKNQLSILTYNFLY